jgi:hypothetical protein
MTGRARSCYPALTQEQEQLNTIADFQNLLYTLDKRSYQLTKLPSRLFTSRQPKGFRSGQPPSIGHNYTSFAVPARKLVAHSPSELLTSTVSIGLGFGDESTTPPISLPSILESSKSCKVRCSQTSRCDQKQYLNESTPDSDC